MKRQTNDLPSRTIPLNQMIVEGKIPGAKEVDGIAAEFKAVDGMIFAIIVAEVPSSNGKKTYLIKDGKKRFVVARSLGWKEIKCIIVPYFPKIGQQNDALADKFADVISRMQRKEITDYDIGKTGADLKEKFRLRVTNYADVMGLSQGYAYNLTRWYSSMPPAIRDAWKGGDPFLSQLELERMSHMPPHEIIPYYEKRQQMLSAPGQEPFVPGKRTKYEKISLKPRRATESQMLELQKKLEGFPLIEPVKSLCISIVQFSLGVSRDVPGITKTKKLAREILTRENKEAITA